MAQRHDDIDGYISSFPDDVRTILDTIRRTLHETVADLGETMSYQMPTMTLDGRPLLYFAAWKHHIGVYPIPELEPALEQEVAPYRAAKDTVRFPLRQPIPYDLVGRLGAALAARRHHAG